MKALGIAFVLLLALGLGLLAGWAARPGYRPPAGEPEQQLRQRATDYYRASKHIDFAGMSQHFSPARQLVETDALLAEAALRADTFERMPDETRADLEQQSASITPESVQVQIEDGWALTSGTSLLKADELELNIPFEELVWVRQGSEWWVFSFTPEELNSYGHPPDFAMHLKGPI